MPNSYERRIEALEAALLPERQARCCMLWNEADPVAAIARWRIAHDWPDDGRHPIVVPNLSWKATPPVPDAMEFPGD